MCDWLEGGSTEWCIHAVEQLQEQHADPLRSLRRPQSLRKLRGPVRPDG